MSARFDDRQNRESYRVPRLPEWILCFIGTTVVDAMQFMVLVLMNCPGARDFL